MGVFDLSVIAPRAITDEGERSCEIAVSNGRIAAVEQIGANLAARRTIRLGDDEVLLPGLVDTHVHVNEPGRTEWEGFASATASASAGGITTILDMPLNSVPPTVDFSALMVKRAAAREQCHVDVGFLGGAVPGNRAQLGPLHQAGVFGFKCFLADSGVPEFGHLDDEQMRAAMADIAALDSVLLVHAEDASTVATGVSTSSRRYRDFLDSRPPAAEVIAINRVIEAARETGARVHILHLSSAEALPEIAAAKSDGVRISVETCPHYLTLAADDIPDGATEFKCCPPIRDADNQARLWAALERGVIDCVVSDHSPSTVELKRLDTGDFAAAWGGIASLQLGLPLIWTHARRRGHLLADVVRWMASGPARLAGLGDKGTLAVGAWADLVVFAPDATFTVDPARLHHRNPVTPYAGMRLTGVVRQTWLRGALITGEQPIGWLLDRPGSRAPLPR